MNEVNDLESVAVDVGSDTAGLESVAVADYNPDEVATLKDIAEAAGVTRLTANKRLASAGVAPIAKLATGKAGRPPVLFPRGAADAALAASVTRSDTDTVAQAAAEALAE